MQKQTLIIALLILAMVLWLGGTVFKQVTSTFVETAKKIGVQQVAKI